jgi:hypothetical protein
VTVYAVSQPAFHLANKLCRLIADLSSFYHHLGDTQRLVNYEMSLPQLLQYHGKKLKGFCVHHKEDFEEINRGAKTKAIAAS